MISLSLMVLACEETVYTSHSTIMVIIDDSDPIALLSCCFADHWEDDPGQCLLPLR